MNLNNINTNNINKLNGNIVNLKSSNLHIQGHFNVNSNLIHINSNHKIGILKNNPHYTVDINGDINYTGNIYKNGNLVNVEYYSVNNLWSKSDKYLYYPYNVSIGSNKITDYDLYVENDSYFNSNIKIKNLIESRNISCLEKLFANDAEFNNLKVNDSFILTCDIDNNNHNIYIKDLFGSNIHLTNNLSADTITSNKLDIYGSTTYNSNVLINDNLGVLGELNLSGNLNINNKKFFIQSSNGEVTMQNTLNVGGSAFIKGILNVVDSTTLNLLTVNNNLTVNGNLNLSGNIYLNNSNGVFNNLIINQNLTSLNLNIGDSSGGLIINNINHPTSPVQITYTNLSTDYKTGSLVVNGGVGIGGNLIVRKSIKSNSGISNFYKIMSTSIIVDELISNSDSTINGNLNVNLDIINSGNITCQGITVSNILSVTNSTQINSQLNVTDNVTCSNDVSVGNNLLVTGTANLAGGYYSNSRLISDTNSDFNILLSYSNQIFTLNTTNIIQNIYLPDINYGIQFEIIIGPEYLNTGNKVKLISATNIFGIINNNSILQSIPINQYTNIIFDTNNIGDNIKISSVIINNNPSDNLGYYINAVSSNSNGFSL